MNSNHQSHGLTFLFSDLDTLPERFFQGHAFIGTDYVFGQRGALDFEAHSGAPVMPGEDGSYVTIMRDGDRHLIGVDHNGSKKLFHYQHQKQWCVSNSLFLLTEHIRGRGLPLTVNFPRLAALKASGTFASQQATTTSIFNEIKLLPTSRTLLVTEAGLEARQQHGSPAGPEPYRRALDQYVKTWVSRLRTLLRDSRTWLNVDLSGGVDSRTVFALVAAASLAEGKERVRNQVHLRSSTSPRQADDLQAASAVANRFGWPLNGTMTGRPTLLRLTSVERYSGWKDLSLGVYSSVYFPDRRANPMVINFHGSGGGHRRSYLVDKMADQVAGIRNVEPTYLLDAWRREVIREAELWREERPWAPPLDTHYHEFRNRFHAGLLPQYSTVFAPLGSRHIELMARHPEKVRTGQIVFDIMESLLPGLKDMPYSTDDRRPSPTNLQNLTVSDAVEDSEAGQVFGSLETGQENPSRAPKGHLELMADELDASSTPLVTEFVGQQNVEGAAKIMNEAVNMGRFEHPGDGKHVTRVLAAAFAFSAAEL